MTTSSKILLVEDDQQLSIIASDALTDAGYICECATNGEDGLRVGLSSDFDLVLLDVNLPQLSGLDVCRLLKQAKPEVSIIMLTARGDESDIISGLEVGADEYLVKPISPKELIARVRARLREKQWLKLKVKLGNIAPSAEQEGSKISIGNLVIDTLRNRVYSMGKEIELSANEFDFIALLASAPGRIFHRSVLLSQIWETENQNYWSNVTVMVSRLRSKLVGDPLADHYIVTIRGRGYSFAEPEQLAALSPQQES